MVQQEEFPGRASGVVSPRARVGHDSSVRTWRRVGWWSEGKSTLGDAHSIGEVVQGAIGTWSSGETICLISTLGNNVMYGENE